MVLTEIPTTKASLDITSLIKKKIKDVDREVFFPRDCKWKKKWMHVKVFKPKDACRKSNRLKNRESEEIPIFIEEYKCMGEALRRIT